MRTKSNRMELIQKMNLCGQDLENVAVLRNMPNLEVISLSVNKLRTLADFSECPKLAELYVRKNDIRDLAEVQHLMHLRHLRVLWLSDNPCTILPHYRAYVLHHLPGLTKLDSSDVTDDERRNAARAYMECVPTCLGQEPDSGCVAEPCDRADASSESRDQRAPRRATESGGSISRHMQSHTSAAPHRFSSPPELPTETEGMNERKPQMSNSRRSVRPGGFQDSAAAAHNDRALHQCIRCEGNAHLVVLDISWNLCKMDCMRRGHWSGFHQRTSNSDQITINSKVILSMTCITIKPGKIDHSKHGLPVLMRRALLLLSREALTHMPGQAPQTDLKLGLPSCTG